MLGSTGWRIKAFTAILIVCLMPAAAVWANENNLGWMKVVNCEEWVSLREKPDAASECLVQVPLGALVENCSTKTKAFIYAEYNGLSGYIMAQYLEPVPQEQLQIGDLYVVDRGEWIAMRLQAADDVPVIQWLAPGARMEACVDSLSGFAYGQCNGLKGYVRLTDLQAAEDMAQ